MNRSALVLISALAVGMLSGCGSDAPIAELQPELTGAQSQVTPPASTRPVARAATRPSNALSWGEPRINDEDLDHAVRAAWGARHGVAAAAVQGEQLFLGLADNGALMVGAYQLWAAGGQAHVVVAQAELRSEAVLVRDSVARSNLTHVEAIVSRRDSFLIVAAAPGTTRVQYRPSAGDAFRTVDQDSADLVIPRPRTAGAGEALRVTRNGTTSVAPVWGARAHQPTAGDGRPSNVLGWPTRGSTSSGPSNAVVARAYAKEMKAPSAKVSALFVGDTDGGVRYLLGQAWVPGKPAQTVGYIQRPGREGELHIQPATPAGARLVALLVTEQPGTTTDLLVVVSEPGTKAVAYRQSPQRTWSDVSTVGYLQGVALVDRVKNITSDQLRLSGRSTLVVSVAKSLCDGSGCP